MSDPTKLVVATIAVSVLLAAFLILDTILAA